MEDETKKVSCRNGHIFNMPLKETYVKCPVCSIDVIVRYFGTINGKFY